MPSGVGRDGGTITPLELLTIRLSAPLWSRFEFDDIPASDIEKIESLGVNRDISGMY
ncbi:hypothetical protein PGTUg99_030827 [Puccinia graminis f. sp. tritici]|uniref:Uncharacterized protein n=1 Tax=Puccinia graminis f. sp. tritici TaxID=56615 RepID=A0A5B0SE21_PUCGR|nr:hypothetical protein PGTUg99_030827 [Puccinia graminis f. sp. tritici]